MDSLNISKMGVKDLDYGCENMGKNDFNLIIIIGVLIIIFLGVIVFFPSSTQNPIYINIEQPQIPQTPQTTEPSNSSSDLRLIANLWITAYPNTQTICETLGGTWHFEQNWAGCEGAGKLDCSTADVLFLNQQCIGAGGNSVCNLNNLYCKIG